MRLQNRIKVGDLVSHIIKWDTSQCGADHGLQDMTGLVIKICGRKWIRVKWSDNVIHNEHIDDLEIVNSVTK